MAIIWKVFIIISVLAVCSTSGLMLYVAASNTKISIVWAGEKYINTTAQEMAVATALPDGVGLEGIKIEQPRKWRK